MKSQFMIMRVVVEAHFNSIINLRPAPNDSASSIKGVLDAYQQHIRALKALGRPLEFWDDWLVHEIVNKLSFEARKQWTAPSSSMTNRLLLNS